MYQTLLIYHCINLAKFDSRANEYYKDHIERFFASHGDGSSWQN